MKASRIVLGVALFALSVLFSLWYHDSSLRVAAMIFFTLPPLLLLVGVLRGNAKASFWSGVFGLFWFSHGVMVAWTRPPERLLAWLEIALALLVIGASSWAGLRARFGRRRGA